MGAVIEQRWLAYLGSRGDQAASPVHGYDRLALDWSVSLPCGLPEHLVYLLVAGAVAGTVEREVVRMRAGALLWLAPRTPFHLHAVGDTEPMLYRFRLATAEPCPVQHLLLPDAWSLRPTMDAIALELGSVLDHRVDRLRALFVVLFSSVFRLRTGGHRIAPLGEDIRARVEEYVDAHIAERPTGSSLAAAVGLSADYFARRFRETFGSPPRTWLVCRRIQHAMLWLDESDEPISMIARRLGYPDVFLFSRQFKLITGVSPRSWRERVHAAR